MALLPLPSPAALFELTRYAVGQAVETAASIATIPVRAVSLLGQAELLVSRLTVMADSAETLIDRVGSVVSQAQETITAAQTIAAAAALTVDEATALTTGAARVMGEAALITTDAARLVGQAGGVTAEAAELVGRAGGVTGEAAELVDRAGAITAGAGSVVGAAGAATGAAGRVLEEAAAASAEAVRLLGLYAPTLDRAAPLAARFVHELTPDEVTAAIKLVDQLPRLREHLVQDVMPLLGKLDQVGPDLHHLLEVTQDLHLAIAGLPGLKMLKRRGEERVAEEEELATNSSKQG